MSTRDCDGSKVTASVCQGQAAPRSLLPNSFRNPFLWPWRCLVAGPAGQSGLLLSPGGSFAVSTLQQPLRRHLEAGQRWLVGGHGGWQALLTLGAAQLSPFPCTAVNRQRHGGGRKPLLTRALTQRILYLAAASSRNHPSPGKKPLLHKNHSVLDQHGQGGNITLVPGHWGRVPALGRGSHVSVGNQHASWAAAAPPVP